MSGFDVNIDGKICIHRNTNHARIQKVMISDTFFKLMRVEDPKIQIPLKSGPSSARQRNAIQMAFHWRADDGPIGSFVMFQGIRTSDC